jgi:DNA primase large subunit
MAKIKADTLLSLEAYSKARGEIRKNAIQHKNLRKVFIGPNVVLQFEDEQTIRYQIQEILRIEKTFEYEEIEEELEAYNPLVPDGTNWKVTQTIEFPDVEERKEKLVQLKGIESKTYVQIADFPRVYAIADEDLPRENEEKTSAVHFLRLELTKEMVDAARAGADIAMGIDHSAYSHHIGDIDPATKTTLIQDFN